MIDYDKHILEMMIHCDICDDTDVADGEWNECIATLKTKGWRIYKDEHNEWQHECPACVKGPTPEEDFG